MVGRAVYGEGDCVKFRVSPEIGTPFLGERALPNGTARISGKGLTDVRAGHKIARKTAHSLLRLFPGYIRLFTQRQEEG